MNEIEKSEDYGGNTEESVYKKKRYLVKVAVFLILTRIIIPQLYWGIIILNITIILQF